MMNNNVKDVWLHHDLITTNIVSTLAAIALTSAAVVMMSRRCSRRATTAKTTTASSDPYAIDPCPNPGCIRCQKYALVQQQAIRKLPWIMRNEGETLDRVARGIRLGRDQPRNSKDGHHQSPTAAQYPTVLLIPQLLTRPLLTDVHNSACSYMEEMMDVIASEFQAAAAQHLSWNHNDIGTTATTAPWTVLHLLNQGQWIPEHCQTFPETVRVVQRLEHLLAACIFGNVFFSRIQTGSRIAPHCGPTNVRHRLHLTVVYDDRDDAACVLRVRDEHVTWQPGRAFVFDDSLVHSVDYATTTTTTGLDESERIVLIVDLWHPELTVTERRAICDLYPTT